ncbi:MAG TPA: tripartite tricarboxylate transporter TctB family protein [candidate division Zixibacteria bacterium]|nr:tripartite tricarboxylate transporter TctB family protein [candidate division Zixibacteria bacterium]
MKKIRIDTDVASGLFWLAVAWWVCRGGLQLGLGTLTEPGSGFVFFWSGIILGGLAIALVLATLAGKNAPAPVAPGVRWRKIFGILAVLVAYGLVLERVGFIPATFGLFVFLLRLSDETRWGMIVATSGATSLGTFALFDLWLKIRLPRGFLGF